MVNDGAFRRRKAPYGAERIAAGPSDGTTWPFGEYENTGRLSDIAKRPVGFAIGAAAEILAGVSEGFGGGAVVSAPLKGLSAIAIARQGQRDATVARLMGATVDQFMANNSKRIGAKIGNKMRQGRLLPDTIPIGREGFNTLTTIIQTTLSQPSRVSRPFVTSGGNRAVDVYSASTGMTVRVRSNGTFDTLIPNRTKR